MKINKPEFEDQEVIDFRELLNELERSWETCRNYDR